MQMSELGMARNLKQDVLNQFKSVFYCFKLINKQPFCIFKQPFVFISELFAKTTFLKLCLVEGHHQKTSVSKFYT